MAQQGTPDWMQAFMAQQQQLLAQQQQQMAQQQQQMAQQQQEMQELREQQQAQVQILQNALAQTNETVQALQRPTPTENSQAPTPAPERPRRTKHILPDPPKFNGTRSEYEGWKSLIKDKIEVDGEVIGSNRNQFIYVSSRLEGTGLQLPLTFIKVNRDTPDASAASILAYLDGIFGDRHKAQRAVETLRTMRQSPRELFSAFLPRFEKALADAGGMAWPDEAKRSHLDGALAFELRRLAITMPAVSSYSAYVNELLRLSDLYRATMKHAPKEQQAARRDGGEAMDWEPTRAAAAAPKSGRKRRALWVSQGEMEKRRQEGRCFRCGSSEHQVHGCEFLPARRPAEASARGSRAAPGKSTVVEPLLEEEGSDVEDNSRVEELN
jgi:DNA-binding protein H-NS